MARTGSGLTPSDVGQWLITCTARDVPLRSQTSASRIISVVPLGEAVASLQVMPPFEVAPDAPVAIEVPQGAASCAEIEGRGSSSPIRAIPTWGA